MSRWQRSTLLPGDTVRVPESVFVANNKRLISSRYVSETAAGLLIELSFLPSYLSEEVSSYTFKIFINWTSIFCGAIKLLDGQGNEIRAIRRG